MGNVRKLLSNIVVVFFLFIMPSITNAKGLDLYSKDIPLDNSCALKVRETESQAVSFTLFCDDKTVQTMEIPSALIRDNNIQKANLRGQSEKVYFITAWNRSSTYGAQTNVVLWRSPEKWTLVKAPFNRGFIVDKNKDGVFDIIDYYPTKKEYLFENGSFIEINEKQ